MKVAIFGSGIAGLTAAHELVERGFEVTVFEKNKIVGGKARSFLLAGENNPSTQFPGEHGFRFFLRWYENLHHTLQRIPTENGKTVFDNLTAIDELLIDDYIFSFVKAEPIPIRPPVSWIKALTSCKQRHEEEFEETAWDSFVEQNLKDEKPEIITFFKNTPKATASVHSKDASVRALSYTLNRLLMNPGLDVLNGPTNSSWFDYWQKYLESRGVEFQFESELQSFEISGKEIIKAFVLQQDNLISFTASHYLSCLPPKALENVLSTEQLKNHNLGNLSKLKSGWQAGIIFYLKEAIHLPKGHFGFSCSTWAISGIQQSDFWTDKHLKDFVNDKNYGASLSLIIADWDAPGDLYGKAARECTLSEIISELKFQLEKYAPDNFKESFSSMIVVDYTIDPGIHLTGDKSSGNDTPLFMNTTNSWQARPEAKTAITNFYIAGDFTKTSAYLTTMESANESGRRAANAILKNTAGEFGFCKILEEKHNKLSKILSPLIKIDEILYPHNKKHILDYLKDEDVTSFIDKLMPYMQFEGSMLTMADGLYDSMTMLLEILSKELPDINNEVINLLFPNKKPSDQHFVNQLNDRAMNWAKVNMLLVDYMPKQFPDSLNSYIDTKNPIFKPMLHVVKQKGSMHRVQYAMAVNEWYGVAISKVSHLLETGQSIHNCSLLIDDVMDNTKIRRNAKTAHEIFGANQTLCAAYTTYFQILISTYINLGDKCMTHYLEETSRAHIGQSEDIYYRENKICPSEEKYLEIIANKTGSFFRVFALCLSALSEKKIQPVINKLIFELADVIGLLFQVRDDYLDLVSEEYFDKKGTIASDFEEGKYSYPVVYCLTHFPKHEATFQAILGKPDISESEKYDLLAILQKTGSLDQTLEKIKELYLKAIDLTQSVGIALDNPNSKLLNWVEQMAQNVPGLDTSIVSLGVGNPKTVSLATKDPFEIKELKYGNVVRILRNVFSSYVIYFKPNNWTEHQFWKCFPLLVTVEAMILNLDDHNETKEGDAPVITDEIVKKSKAWGMISKSSFYTEEMDEILDFAKKYYSLERNWYTNQQSILNEESVKFMNHHKSTNFRILHLLSKNILEECSESKSFHALEDYVSALIEEREAPQDGANDIYNVLLHAKKIKNNDPAFFTSYKNQLLHALSPEQEISALEWMHLYRKAEEQLTNLKHKVINTGLKNIYATANEIAGICNSDKELSLFTLSGNFTWCTNWFFNEKNSFKTSDSVLRRLQNEALLSLGK